MKWELYAFQLPLIFGGVREGFILRQLISEQEERLSEIAPFPGRSRESLAEAHQQLMQILQTGTITQELVPSVRFGLTHFVMPSHPISAPVYAFLKGEPDKLLRQAEIAEKKRHTTVKLKLSSLPVKTAQSLITELKSRFRLRIDCNSAFSFQEAMVLFSPFDPAIFDYIEDPTYEIDRLKEFEYPFAIDEHLNAILIDPLLSCPKLYGFILKPTLLGGKEGCLPWIELAKRHNRKVVFSPSFETSIGLMQIFKLATSFNLISEPLGLDTQRYLTKDLLTSPIDFSAPRVHLPSSLEVDFKSLQRVAYGTSELSHF